MGKIRSGGLSLPRNFRRLPLAERREALRQALGISREEWQASHGVEELLELADAMIESAVGYLPVPLGVATGFLIDGRVFHIPMAVEEPSVIAAATYAGRIIAEQGGFSTWATDPVMTAQIFLEGVPEGQEQQIREQREGILSDLDRCLESIKGRGGGARGLEISRLPDSKLVRVELAIDVRDAQGANLVNSAAEAMRGKLEAMSGGKSLMCILSNAALERRAGASFTLPVKMLARGSFSGAETARRILLASSLAQEDPTRAVTHNKGIMNGISALALATGNDTRAVEAAAHYYAAREGSYRGLSRFQVVEDRLKGEAELALPLAAVGGAVGLQPLNRFSLKLLGNPSAPGLSRIAAALGLAQNFAALWALVTEGIQKGHLKHHASSLVYRVGARGEQASRLARMMGQKQSSSIRNARQALSEMEEKDS